MSITVTFLCVMGNRSRYIFFYFQLRTADLLCDLS